MQNILILTRLTILEASRRKIILVALLLGLGLIVLHALGFHYAGMQFEAYNEEFSALRQSEFYNFMLIAGYYAVNFMSIMLAALLAATALSGEVASGSIQTLASKSLRRGEIVLGKWLGLAILLGLYLLLLMGGMSLNVWLHTAYLTPGLFQGLGLVYLETLIMMTVTLACSSRLPNLASGAAALGLFGIAFAGSWIEQIGNFVKSEAAVNLGIISSLILPTEALWRRAAYEMTSKLVQLVTGGLFVSNAIPSPLMVVYAGFYLLVALGLCVLLFSGRDL